MRLDAAAATDREQADLLAADIGGDDLYVEHAVSGTMASRPQFDRALRALVDGETLVNTTLDRLGRSTQNMLAFVDELDELGGRGTGLRALNLGGGDFDTGTAIRSILFIIVAALDTGFP